MGGIPQRSLAISNEGKAPPSSVVFKDEGHLYETRTDGGACHIYRSADGCSGPGENELFGHVDVDEAKIDPAPGQRGRMVAVAATVGAEADA